MHFRRWGSRSDLAAAQWSCESRSRACALAPLVREDIWRCLAALKEPSQTILVIDKCVERLVRLADKHRLPERGRVASSGAARRAS